MLVTTLMTSSGQGHTPAAAAARGGAAIDLVLHNKWNAPPRTMGTISPFAFHAHCITPGPPPGQPRSHIAGRAAIRTGVCRRKPAWPCGPIGVGNWAVGGGTALRWRLGPSTRQAGATGNTPRPAMKRGGAIPHPAPSPQNKTKTTPTPEKGTASRAARQGSHTGRPKQAPSPAMRRTAGPGPTGCPRTH